MNDVSDHERLLLQFQYGYVVRKNISRGGGGGGKAQHTDFVHVVGKKKTVPGCLDRCCEILALNYAPGAAAPGVYIIWSNILSQISFRSIFECTILQEHIANMLQEHI